MRELQILYELQQTELQLEKMKKTLKELPVFAEFKSRQSEVADAKESADWAQTKLEEQKKRAKRLEKEVQHKTDEFKDVQSLLYSGTVTNAKELSQLEKRSRSLQNEKDSHEESLLLAMETVEELEEACVRAREEFREKNSTLRLLQKSGNEEIHRLKEEIRVCQEKRDHLMQQISKPLLDEYREKRSYYHGRPLVKAENGNCGGCRVSLSSTVIQNLYKPDARLSCEYCGRILVPVSG